MSSPHCRVFLFPPNPPLSVLSSLDSLSFLPCGEGTRAAVTGKGRGRACSSRLFVFEGGGPGGGGEEAGQALAARCALPLSLCECVCVCGGDSSAGHMKRTTRIPVEERTALIEFLVAKRVKYLQYLRDIHSDEGGLWMNTVYVNRSYLGKYFGVPGDCLLPGGGVGSAGDGSAVVAESETAGFVRIPLDTAHPFGGAPTAVSAAATGGTPTLSAEDEHTYVPLDKLPHPASIGRDSSINEWHRRFLPGYTAFAMALSDLLLMPVSGEEFLECFYHVLLEVEVALSGGIATKALAQRSLKTLRQHLSPAMTAALSAASEESGSGSGGGGAGGGGGGDAGCTSPLAAVESPTSSLAGTPFGASAAANSTSSDQLKLVFVQSPHLSFTGGTPSYDVVMPALFSTMIFAYRRLCDYELTNREDCVKRILSIDKRIERILFARLGKELEKAAKLKLIREAYVLSSRGLFSEIAGGEAAVDFINDIIAAAAQHSESQKAKASSGSSDCEDAVDA